MNFKGKIFNKGDEGYEEARAGRVFNHRRPQRYPASVFFPLDENDVVEAVKFAKHNNYKIALRAGGHSWAAWSVRDEGILLDLQHLNKISLNNETNIVSAGPAVKGGTELNVFLKEHDLFFNGGHCPTVGIGGFLLQGGQGWNARGWGWSAEYIVAIDVVTANGELVRADANNHADLFWAARGAGPGFFGVVTCFHLKARSYPKALTATTLIFSSEHTQAVLSWLHTIHHTVKNTVEIVAVGQTFDFGEGIVVHALAFEDDYNEAKHALSPFENCPVIDKTVVHKSAIPTTIDAECATQIKMNPEQHRWTVSNAWLQGSNDEVVNQIQNSFKNFPSKKTFTLWFSMAPLRSLPNMAFSLQTEVYFAIYSVWENKEDDAACRQWVKEQIKHIEPVTAGQYLGDSDFTADQRKFMADSNWMKLQQIKKQYDPANLFHSYLCKEESELNKNVWNKDIISETA